MRCKRCGAVLKKNGDLCTKCSNEIRKERLLEQDKEELYKVKKKYAPKYILTKQLLEVYLVFFIVLLLGMMSGKILYIILPVFLLMIIMFGVLAISKKNSKKSCMTFYDKKVVYKGKMYFMTVNRTLAYEDIKEIVFTQGNGLIERFFQKIFNIGNIYIYPKKGNIISSGMQLEIVGNFDKVIENIKSVVGDKLRNG